MALVLFVCTGNICRSAMAEGIAREVLEGVDGLEFSSAGTYPYPGGATHEARAAAAEVGVDLSRHRSQAITVDLLTRADRVYGMTGRHVRDIRELAEARPAALLDPEGAEIDDPYGGSMADYRRARDAVTAAIFARADEWRALP